MKEQSSAMSLTELAVGSKFTPAQYVLGKDLVAKYLEAVEGGKEFLADGLVPPLAIAACAMTTIAQSVSIPPGSIHASQDFDFLKPLAIGASVNCSGHIVQKLERGGLCLIMLEINVSDHSGDRVVTGKATIAAPKQTGRE
jgi:acyl dehydratase